MTDDDADSEQAPATPLPGPWSGVPEESARAAVFMSDPSAEAARVAQLLAAAGHVVVDVPLSLLATRVEVQTPRVIVVDADAAGLDEALATVRGMDGAGHIHVIVLGPRPEGDAAADRPEGAPTFFARPVDAIELVAKIDSLMRESSAGPPSSPPSIGPRSVRSGGPASARGGSADRRSPVPASFQPPSSASSSVLSARSGRPAISIQTSLSAELEALLAEADQRIAAQMAFEASPPSPEEELEAVLPEELLAALDEPIDDDEDDLPLDAPRSERGAPPAPQHAEAPAFPDDARQETNAGRALTPAMAEGHFTGALGVAPTMAAPALDEAEGAFVIPEAPVPVVARSERALAPASVNPVGADDAPAPLAAAIAARASGCLTYESGAGIRRVLLREGDVLTAASSAEDEALLVFLTVRGDVRKDDVKDLVGKVPAFGRHAGAALVGHGLLGQDQLWPILRAHAEWVLGRTLLTAEGTWRLEEEAPGRLRQEPSVFGGSSGAEVLVDVVRRVIAPEEALRRVGGAGATVADGPSSLLGECALDAEERALIEGARGATLGDLVERAGGPDITSAIYALALLGVVAVAAPSPDTGAGQLPLDATTSAVEALDASAVRDRVLARLDLVSEADYFTLLGVPRQATGYEVRRAYLELRRSFEPARLLTPALEDLSGPLRTIVAVLDEAYEILRDPARRERYRRALGDEP